MFPRPTLKQVVDNYLRFVYGAGEIVRQFKVLVLLHNFEFLANTSGSSQPPVTPTPGDQMASTHTGPNKINQRCIYIWNSDSRSFRVHQLPVGLQLHCFSLGDCISDKFPSAADATTALRTF